MVSTRKKRQSNRRLLSQLDDSDQDMIIGYAASERQENTVVNEGTDDRDFTVGTSNDSSIVNGNVMNVKTLEGCFNERIDREMNNIVDTVEDRIQNGILTAIDNIVAPKIELAIMSINASSGREATSVSVNSERRKHVGINASFENASGNNNTLGVSNVNDETRQEMPEEVGELSVPETRLNRQPHTHHNRQTHYIGYQAYIIQISHLIDCLRLFQKPTRKCVRSIPRPNILSPYLNTFPSLKTESATNQNPVQQIRGEHERHYRQQGPSPSPFQFSA